MIRIGLIGAGKWGRNYIPIIRDLRTHLTNSAVLQAVVARHDITQGAFTVLRDWRSAVSWPTVDALIVATPASTHYEIARACIEARKPALIEKPLCMDVREAHELLDGALARNAALYVGYIDLHNPAFRHMQEIIRSDMPERAEIRLTGFGPVRTDCSPLWDYGPHAIAMALSIFDEYPARIEAEKIDVLHTDALAASPERESFNVSVRMYFSNRRHADLVFGNAAMRMRQVKVFTGRHVLVYDGHEGSLLVNGHLSKLGGDALRTQTFAFVQDLASGKFDVTTLRLSVNVTSVLAECERQLAVRM